MQRVHAADLTATIQYRCRQSILSHQIGFYDFQHWPSKLHLKPKPYTCLSSSLTLYLSGVLTDLVKLFIWMTKHTKPAKKVCPKAQSFSASEACYAVLHYALPMHSCYLIHTFNTTFAFHLATKRIEENGCTLYTGSTPLLPPGVISLGACKLVSTTLLHVLPSGALGRWASMAKV